MYNVFTPRHPTTFFAVGIISLSLTAVNILVVWLAAALMFRIKEVLPVKKSKLNMGCFMFLVCLRVLLI